MHKLALLYNTSPFLRSKLTAQEFEQFKKPARTLGTARQTQSHLTRAVVPQFRDYPSFPPSNFYNEMAMDVEAELDVEMAGDIVCKAHCTLETLLTLKAP
eukprot:75853_1